MARLRRRGWFLKTLIAVAAAVVVVLVGLIAAGVLVLPLAPPTTVTISEVQWTVLEGTTAQGYGWFGNSSFTWDHRNGFPLTLSPGSSFQLPWTTANMDGVNHTIYSVSVNPPFRLVSTWPTVPVVAPGGEDSVVFEFQISVPSTASGSMVLQVTVNALN